MANATLYTQSHSVHKSFFLGAFYNNSVKLPIIEEHTANNYVKYLLFSITEVLSIEILSLLICILFCK